MIDDDSPKGEVRLFLSNVPFKATEEQIVEFVKPIGEVLSITMPRDPTTRLRRGYVFVSVKVPEGEHAPDWWMKLDGGFMAYPGPEQTLRRITVKLATKRQPYRAR